MTLHDAIQDDAINVFCNASDFGESVTYYPRSGSPRSIVVVAIRNEIQLLEQDGDSQIEPIEIHVANNSTDGISSSEIAIGQDQILIAKRVGETPSRMTIQRLLGNDEGMLSFLIA